LAVKSHPDTPVPITRFLRKTVVHSSQTTAAVMLNRAGLKVPFVATQNIAGEIYVLKSDDPGPAITLALNTDGVGKDFNVYVL